MRGGLAHQDTVLAYPQIEDGETVLAPAQIAIATALLHRQALTR